MKQLATIGAVVLILLGAALYFGSLKKDTPTPDPVVTTPDPTPNTDPNQPIVNGSADGTLKLRTALSNGYLLQGGVHEVYAAIDVEAIHADGGERPPLNVAVVIDRSGSMSGGKIEHAKAAARRLVNVLGENDRVAVVSYGSDVTVDFYSQPVNDSTRMSLFSAINNIAIGGGTNLSGGFQRGYSEVAKWKSPETINRVILMSDGHANIGITNQHQLVNLTSNALGSKVSVSTIGMGLDYNEDLMTNMANEGAGNYYFVDRAETIGAIFDQEIQGLASTVARNTAIVLKLGEGVTLDELHGFASQTSGNQVYVSLAEFASEQKKNILVKLKVDGTKLGQRPVLETSMSYDDVLNDKPAHHSLALSSVVTTDSQKVGQMVNVDVIARVQQVEVAKTLKTAMDMYDRGEADKAAATLGAAQQQMRERREKYEFKNSARYDFADQELDDLKGQIQAAPSANKSESGRRMIKKSKARSNAIMQTIDTF